MESYVELEATDGRHEWATRLVRDEHRLLVANKHDERSVLSSVVVSVDEHGRTKKYLILDSKVFLKTTRD